MKRRMNRRPGVLAALALTLSASGCTGTGPDIGGRPLTDDEIDNLVRRSYPYVAMYNVHRKFAQAQGGWNTVRANTELKDHTMREIAWPNNDTFYIGCMLDLRGEAVILDIPAFGSDYASLMITAHDRYVNVPMSTRTGEFAVPQTMLIYSARTRNYHGEPIEGIDRVFEVSGDFVSAVFRVMPHAGDPVRFERIVEKMREVRLRTLAEYRGGAGGPPAEERFPVAGATDFDTFENNLLEVTQFVFDHTTFDADDDIDLGVLAAYEPLGIAPGRSFDPETVAAIDGVRIRKVAERIASEQLALAPDPRFAEANLRGLFRPRGQRTLSRLLFQSVMGPIGLPADEAVYPAIETADGEPMNASHDYVIRMSGDEMPPATAFWSLTLCDTETVFSSRTIRRSSASVATRA